MDLKKIESINRTVMDDLNQNKSPTSTIRRRRTTSKSIKRDQTPDPSSRIQSSQKNTDEESYSSAGDFYFANGNSISEPTSPMVTTPPPSTNGEMIPKSATVSSFKRPDVEPGGHRSMILSRREKAVSNKAHRSQSAPRKESETQTSTTAVINCITEPVSKRSLSLPRKRDESSESDAAVFARLTIPAPGYSSQCSSPIEPSDKQTMKLELNLRKFEEDRRKFELEKLRFIQQKRELDRMRLARFEKYKNDKLGKDTNKGLSPYNLQANDVGGLRPDSPMPPRTKVKPTRLKMKKHHDYVSSTADSSDDDTSDGHRRSVSRKMSKSPMRYKSKSPRRHSSKTPTGEKSPIMVLDTPSPTEEKEIFKNGIHNVGTALQVRRRSSVKVKKGLEIDSQTQNEVDTKLQSLTQLPEKEKIKDIFVDAQEQDPLLPTTGIKGVIVPLWREMVIVWRQFRAVHPTQVQLLRSHIKRCFCMLVVMTIFCGLGGILFRYIEGNFESMYKCGVKRIRRNFIDDLWQASHNHRLDNRFFLFQSCISMFLIFVGYREDEWKSKARSQLKLFEEELQVAFEAGVKSYSGLTAWNFVNSVLYCLTVVTTIGNFATFAYITQHMLYLIQKFNFFF